MKLEPGSQFDHFLIQSHLAEGGMSDTYRASDLLNGRQVVIKIPDRMMIGDPAQHVRFQRELEVMATLQHPAIQKGIGSGRFNRMLYLVTEWVDGQGMRELMKAQGRFSPNEAIHLLHKIAEGLAYCHDHGVIHRDLKPENILITAEGQPVLLDFGLALTTDAPRVTYANLSHAVGTPIYMAPEQVEGQRGDQRTDLYALGIILYELLAGEPPFQGDDALKLMEQHVKTPAPRLDRVRPDVSPPLVAIVARCLRRDPKQRYPDIQSLLHDLDHLESVDTSILNEGDEFRASTWRSSPLVGVGLGVSVIVIAIILGLVLQAVKQGMP